MGKIPSLSITTHKSGYKINIPARYNTTGKRGTVYFKTIQEGEIWKKDFIRDLLKYGESSNRLSRLEEEDALLALEILGQEKVSLSDAARFWISKNCFAGKRLTLHELLNEYKETKKGYTKSVLLKIGRTRKVFTPLLDTVLSNIQPKEIYHTLNAFTNTPSMFNEALRVIRGAFNYGFRMGYISENTALRIDYKKENSLDISVLTAEQTKLLLIDEKIGIAAAFLIFAGIRTAELSRLTWKNVDITEHNVITIDKFSSKTASHRLVEICDTLKKWIELVPIEKRTGPLMPLNWITLWTKARKNAGIDKLGTRNICRHSYASYFLALTNDMDRLRVNMGHLNSSMTLKHYRARVYKRDAEEYFSLTPEKVLSVK